MSRAQRRAAKQSLSGATQAVAWVQANPIDAAAKIAELERSANANYGLMIALMRIVEKDHGALDVLVPRGDWQSPDPTRRLVIEPDAEMNVTLRLEAVK